MRRLPCLQELPASLGRLQRLKLLQLDSNQISGLPPTVLRDCSALVGGWVAGGAGWVLQQLPRTPRAVRRMLLQAA